MSNKKIVKVKQSKPFKDKYGNIIVRKTHVRNIESKSKIIIQIDNEKLIEKDKKTYYYKTISIDKLRPTEYSLDFWSFEESRNQTNNIMNAILNNEKIEPISVVKDKEQDIYYIIDGHHRFRSYNLLGVKEVRVYGITDYFDDEYYKEWKNPAEEIEKEKNTKKNIDKLLENKILYNI